MSVGADLKQREYYERTAEQYDDMHVRDGDEHGVALELAAALMTSLGVRTVLDVGAGTGRTGRRLRPAFEVTEVEPVVSLMTAADVPDRSPAPRRVCGSGYHLPFADDSFDAVCETGTLHHVRRPNRVVEEMLRVSRRAVFLSDSNRFGQGRLLARVTKLSLYKSRLWPAFRYVQTRGRWYHWSEGDGVAYSYSVYDSLTTVAAWAEQVFLLPVKPVSGMNWAHPLLTTNNVLLCGIRGGWPGASD